MKTSPISGIYAIVDSAELALHCLKSKISLIQLRIKNQSENIILQEALSILNFKKEFSFTFIINDDPILAKKCDADGVHLGQTDSSVVEARKILGDKIIGKSSHSLWEAQAALNEAIDYLALGAIFETSSKPKGHPIVGLDVLKKICDLSLIPVVAIGGITKQNMDFVYDSGASAVAMISGLRDF